VNFLYAVIPSCCRREELTNLVKVLTEDGVCVIVVDTGYDPPLEFDSPWWSKRNVIKDHEQPKNISRWWNRGLEMVAAAATWHPSEDYAVAVINDDVVASPGLVRGLADAIERYGVAAAFPDIWGVGRDAVMHQPSGLRMSGYCFALRGSANLRADETMQWWYSDNDLEHSALHAGGVALVGGLTIQHLYPSSTTIGELAEQARRDGDTFVAKWGYAP
jgi:hypothetical protein